jgi:hypothetical protein
MDERDTVDYTITATNSKLGNFMWEPSEDVKKVLRAFEAAGDTELVQKILGWQKLATQQFLAVCTIAIFGGSKASELSEILRQRMDQLAEEMLSSYAK